MPMHSLAFTAAAIVGFGLSAALSMAFGADNGATLATKPAVRPHRLVVLTDIEADPDDTQSLVRLLLYSNEIDIQALVATTSTWKRSNIAPKSIHAVIAAYGKVHDNLLLHDPKYPTAAALDELVTSGQPGYGMGDVGDGKDTEGSEQIIRILEQDDDRPVWISVWGGVNTLAQSLHKIRATKSPEEVDRLVAKLRVYTISDQDDAGPWLRKTFPKLFFIVSPGGDYHGATWTGINSVVEGIDNTTISNKWLAENIQQRHGPLGAAYPDVAWGMEGDTPAWLALIPNGLNEPDRPNWGGWGGRYELALPDLDVTRPATFLGGVPIEPETRPIWTNAIDRYVLPIKQDYGRTQKSSDKTFESATATLWRWRDDIQNDFAARIDWTIRPYAEANHPPVAVLAHPDTLTVKSGKGFGMSARGSYDPDGDSLSYFWFNYREAGTFAEVVKIGVENSDGVWLNAPTVDKPETLHFIVKVTDKGSPPLTRYKRVIVNVVP
jgi:hypothetical protein